MSPDTPWPAPNTRIADHGVSSDVWPQHGDAPARRLLESFSSEMPPSAASAPQQRAPFSPRIAGCKPGSDKRFTQNDRHSGQKRFTG